MSTGTLQTTGIIVFVALQTHVHIMFETVCYNGRIKTGHIEQDACECTKQQMYIVDAQRYSERSGNVMREYCVGMPYDIDPYVHSEKQGAECELKKERPKTSGEELYQQPHWPCDIDGASDVFGVVLHISCVEQQCVAEQMGVPVCVYRDEGGVYGGEPSRNVKLCPGKMSIVHDSRCRTGVQKASTAIN